MTAFLLLGGYFLNVVTFQSVHQLLHHPHDAALHTTVTEADACHRAIYHGEVAHPCGHDGHVDQTHDGCDLCKVTVSRYHFPVIRTADIDGPHESAFYHHHKVGIPDLGPQQAFSPRGPPVLS